MTGSKRLSSFLGKLMDRVETWSNLTGSLLVIFLMLMVTSDVVLRYIYRRSIPGSYELAELLMVGIGFLTLGACQQQKGHLTIGFLQEMLRGVPLQTAETVALFLSLVISVVFCYRTAAEAQFAVSIHLYTPGVVAWPKWPFKIVVAFGFFQLSIRTGIQLAQQIRLLIAGRRSHAQ